MVGRVDHLLERDECGNLGRKLADRLAVTGYDSLDKCIKLGDLRGGEILRAFGEHREHLTPGILDR
ncbi:MAG TPA: hypothetical protein VGO31_01065 [Microbacteriaceae bacterium]|jgi:hypothetical protein|nr:hypothetical protein [Microbacteriaceae bacterium]